MGPDESSYQPQEVEQVGGTPSTSKWRVWGATEVERLEGEGGPQ